MELVSCQPPDEFPFLRGVEDKFGKQCEGTGCFASS